MDEADNARRSSPQTLTLAEALPDDYDDDDGDDVVPVVIFRPERQINQTIDDTSFGCVMFAGFWLVYIFFYFVDTLIKYFYAGCN